MRILVAGDWHSDIHETAVADAFSKLGHEVVKFAWYHYFKKPAGFARGGRHLFRRVQNKFVAGPLVTRVNRDLLRLAMDVRPDAIFVYRGTHITGSTLREIRQVVPGCILIGYNNDDPFGPGQPGWLWKHFLGALPVYDLVLAYRYHNIAEFVARGARRVELLRSWFIAEKNRGVTLNDDEKRAFECDVVFVGHYESDQRVECLEEIVKQGWRLRLFGPGYDWDPVIRNNPWLKDQVPVRLVWGDDYSRAISGGKLALCFLSKLNRDTYTRRCFEIPAIGTLLLSEYTDDLASLYVEEKEASFFRSKEEMVEKVFKYLGDAVLRSSVASKGQLRVFNDGNDVVSRMGQVINWIHEIRRGEMCE